MSIGNANIHQVSEIPEITKLPNGRLRVVRRFNKFTREDVDNANYGSLLGDFGDLDTEGQQIVNQGYTNLKLISVEVDSRFNAVTNNSNAVLVKTYETLTSSFVQVTDEDQIEELENGLKRLTRVLRAQSGTAYNGDVGITTAGSSLASFILSKSDLKDSGAFAELTLTFLTTGITDVREDIIGSQKAIVITKVGSEPTALEASAKSDISYDDSSDWSIARKDVTRESGLEIYTYTFLLDNTVLSQSKDEQNSLKTEVIEVFNPKVTIDGLTLEGGSSVAGNYFLKTQQFGGKNIYTQSQGDTFPKTVSYNTYDSSWKVSQFSGVYAVSTDTNSENEIDPPLTGWNGTGNNEVTNIIFREFDQTLPNSTSAYELSHRYDKEGYSLINIQRSNLDGIPTMRYTFAKDNSVISVSEDKVGSQNAIVNEIFNPSSETITGVDSDNVALSNYSEADRTESNYEGIKTIRVRFLKDNVLLSQTEDKVGSQNRIIKEVFNPTGGTPAPLGGYILANEESSNVNGIATKRVTFLKQNTVLSVSEDKVSSQKAIVNEIFDPTGTISGEDASGSPLSGYSEADRSISEVEGIETVRVRFLKNNVTLSTSEDKVGSQLAIVKETFNGTPSTPSGYSIADKSVSSVDGIPTRRFRFLKNNVTLSTSEDKVGSQLAIVKEVFNGTPATPSGYSIADQQVSNVDGIVTRRFRFLKNNVTLQTTEDKVGSQLAIVKEVFNGTPNTPTGYSIADKQISSVDGIPTRRFRFLKNNVTLSTSEDKIGSQLAIVKEVFNGTPTTPNGYSIASKQESNVGGIATKQFRFLKDNVILSRSIDESRADKPEVIEYFKPASVRLSSPPTGKVLDKKDESNVDGIPTERYTFRKDGAVLNINEDRIGAQQAVVVTKYNSDPTSSDVESFTGDSGLTYVIARKVKNGKERTFTFMESNALLSVSEEKVGSQNAIVNEIFKPTSEASIPCKDVDGNSLSTHTEADRTESNHDGIKTVRVRFLKNNAILSTSEDLIGSQKAVIIEKFGNTAPAITNNDVNGIDLTDDYIIANKQESSVDGIKTFRYTFLQEDTVLSQSIDNESPLLTEVLEVFKPVSSRATKANYVLTNKTESNVNGIPTERYTFKKTGVILSQSYELVGSQEAVVISRFGSAPTTSQANAFGGSNYTIAKKEESGTVNQKTFTYTFLQNNVTLSISEDLVGSQKAIVIEKFGDTEPVVDDDAVTTGTQVEGVDFSGYLIAKRDRSNLDGIKTFRYTYLKPSILSVSQDFVEDVNTIQVTAFNKTEAQVKTALTEVTNNHKLINKRENDHDGIVTNTFTFQINTSDVVSYTANNRLQVVRTIYQSYNYNYNSIYNVGSTTITFKSTTLILSELRVDQRGSTGSFTRLKAIYLEPGESARSESIGPNGLPGTERISITSSGSTPVTLTETDDIKLINKQQQNNNGFNVFVRSYIKGTDATTTTTSYVSGRTYKIASNGNYSAVGGPSSGIIGDYFQASSNGTSLASYLVGQITGTKITYDDIISVPVPGTVKCKQKNAESSQITEFETEGDLTSKSQAFMEVIPPSEKNIKVDVTESIQTSIPDITQLAYNLDGINCSVTKIKTFVSQSPGGIVIVGTGATSVGHGWSRNIQFNTNNSYFPGCYLLDSNTTPSTLIKEGLLYRITSVPGNTGIDITTLGASSNAIGTVFVATSSGNSSSLARWIGAESLFSYKSGKDVSASGNSVVSRYGESDQKSELVPTGTTVQSDGSAPSTYVTTGVIQQKARPVLTTIDGTTYYEVIKFSKS